MLFHYPIHYLLIVLLVLPKRCTIVPELKILGRYQSNKQVSVARHNPVHFLETFHFTVYYMGTCKHWNQQWKVMSEDVDEGDTRTRCDMHQGWWLLLTFWICFFEWTYRLNAAVASRIWVLAESRFPNLCILLPHNGAGTRLLLTVTNLTPPVPLPEPVRQACLEVGVKQCIKARALTETSRCVVHRTSGPIPAFYTRS